MWLAILMACTPEAECANTAIHNVSEVACMQDLSMMYQSALQMISDESYPPEAEIVYYDCIDTEVIMSSRNKA